MNPNLLSGPQRRSISVTLRFLEKSINDLGDYFGLEKSNITVKHTDSVNECDSEKIKMAISVIRVKLQEMFEKYQLEQEEISLERVIDAKNTHLWTILEDSTTKRLKGYGDFPEVLKAEYDQDIQQLLELVAQVKITRETDNTDKQ